MAASRSRLIALLGLASILLAGCGALDELTYDPAITPQEWCEQQPCVQVGDVVVSQPMGSFLVFFLALLWIVAGIYFLVTRAGQRSRSWFGIALIIGGLGAASAGVSFQAFGFQLKCAGRQECLFTNGFEVGFSVSQAVSVSCMLIAIAYAGTRAPARTWFIGYSVLNAVAYLVVAALGVLLPSKFLLSFELLILFAVPGIIAVLVIAIVRYRQSRDPLYARIIWAALLLVVVQVAYFAYFASGLTQTLWATGTGFYFSENDVLHVGMIFWLIYAVVALGGPLRDYSPPSVAGAVAGSAADETQEST